MKSLQRSRVHRFTFSFVYNEFTSFYDIDQACRSMALVKLYAVDGWDLFVIFVLRMTV